MGEEDEEEELIFDDQVNPLARLWGQQYKFGRNLQQIVSAIKENVVQFVKQSGSERNVWKSCTHKVLSIKIVILTNQAETAFDQIVGAIEDIVIDDRFQDLQTDLLEKHFHHFDVSSEKFQKQQKY